MAERIKRLYDTGKLNKDGVRNAVAMALITAADYKAITGEDFETATEENETAEGEKDNEP